MALVTNIAIPKAKQFKSTAPAGTPPLVVASNTLVANLNADLLDGKEATAFAELAGATFTGALGIGKSHLTAGQRVRASGNVLVTEIGAGGWNILNSANTSVLGSVTDAGAFRWGAAVASTHGAAGDIVVANGKRIGCITLSGATFMGISADPTSDFVLNVNTGSTTGSGGFVRIPFTTVMPAASSAFNGLILLDAATNRFCFWIGGQRYYLTGTAF